MPKLLKNLNGRLNDQGVLRLVDRGERLLARMLSVVLLLVLAVAAVQLLWDVGSDLVNPDHVWMGDALLSLLGDMLNLLIGLEVLQNITAYLRRGVVQIQLVLLTAITAVARKVIVMPPGAENKPELLIGLGVAVLCLTAAYWLMYRSGTGRARFNDQASTEPATPSLEKDPSH